MNRKLAPFFAVLALVALSGCDFYGYKAALCGPGNIKDASPYAGAYTYTMMVTEDGQTQPIGEDTPTEIQASFGSFTIAFSDSPNDKKTFAYCEAGGNAILEIKDADDPTQAYGGFLLEKTQSGFDLAIDSFDPTAVKAKMPVQQTTQTGSQDFPVDTTVYIAENTGVAPADFAALLRPSSEIVIHFKKTK